MGWFIQTVDGLEIYRCSELNRAGLIQGFSTRTAGNMGLHTGDVIGKVLDNRQRFLNALNLNLRQLVVADQVHGVKVGVVTRELAGRGAWPVGEAIPKTDALITKERGLILAVVTADCVPIFIYDPVTPAVGIVHAGWRGTLAEILRICLSQMKEHFKTDPARTVVALGPSIQPCCFRVSPELADEFRKVDLKAVSGAVGETRIDLGGFNNRLSQSCGIVPEMIIDSPKCTSCNQGEFFSYRAENGITGRMMGIIALQ